MRRHEARFRSELRLPFSRHTLHRPSHQRVGLKYGVEVADRQREYVAVGFGAHAGYAPRIGQQTDLAKVGAITGL